MDDFMLGAGYRTGTLKAAFTHSLHQQAYLRAMRSFLGLTFSPTKTEVPHHRHALLGITLDVLHRYVGLKIGKTDSVAEFIRLVVFSPTWDLTEIQKISGNTIWLSMILPRVRSYLTPLIELQNELQRLRLLSVRGVPNFACMQLQHSTALQQLQPNFALMQLFFLQ